MARKRGSPGPAGGGRGVDDDAVRVVAHRVVSALRSAGVIASEKRRPSLALAPGRSGEALLTVRQPWASAIVQGIKDIENRVWTTDYRGRLWIHAARATARRESDAWAEERGLAVPPEPLPRGVILGHVELVDIVRDADSPWALPHHYHWILRAPRLLVRPVPWDGKLGLQFIRPPRGATKRPRR